MGSDDGSVVLTGAMLRASCRSRVRDQLKAELGPAFEGLDLSDVIRDAGDRLYGLKLMQSEQEARDLRSATATTVPPTVPNGLQRTVPADGTPTDNEKVGIVERICKMGVKDWDRLVEAAGSTRVKKRGPDGKGVWDRDALMTLPTSVLKEVVR